MVKRYLVIVEVSQKQSYIFKRNELKINVENSSAIAWVTSSSYFSRVAKDVYDEGENLVYSGGGHSVLEFAAETEEKAQADARRFCMLLTIKVHEEFPDMALFAYIQKYDDNKRPSENLELLTQGLEDKKNRRLASFHQGSFGIEKTDSNDFTPEQVLNEDITDEIQKKLKKWTDSEDKAAIVPGYERPSKFGLLGGSEGTSNFIAVVHIDGNGMGNRVSSFYKEKDRTCSTWQDFKTEIKKFSDTIDRHFKDAFEEMTEVIASRIEDGSLEALELVDEGKTLKRMPVRRIITSGDDICYVAEGRIGLESAVVFLKKLAAKKGYDGQPYAACAGVALVHQKYPFYRAYALAEKLCANAKSYGAKVVSDHDGASVSSIDWHIEYGEMQDTLQDIRDQYLTADGNRLDFRPYIVQIPAGKTQADPTRTYAHFRKLIGSFISHKEAYPTGKLKEMRSALKKGETAAKHYINTKHMEDVSLERYQGLEEAEKDLDRLLVSGIGQGEGLDKALFIKDPYENNSDKKDMKHSTLFDAIELMDTYIPLEID